MPITTRAPSYQVPNAGLSTPTIRSRTLMHIRDLFRPAGFVAGVAAHTVEGPAAVCGVCDARALGCNGEAFELAIRTRKTSHIQWPS